MIVFVINMPKMLMFGYGSLINPLSRAKTGKTGNATPAILHDYERLWAIDDACTLTSVGTREGKTGSINGVVVPIPESEQEKFKSREKHYDIVKIPQGQIEILGGATGDVYFCLSPSIVPPTVDIPIVQTYLDVLMQGAFMIDGELGNRKNEFARQLLSTTLGWTDESGIWVNDRDNPIYTRSQIKYPDKSLTDKIDGVTQEMVPELRHRLNYRPKHVQTMTETSK